MDLVLARMSILEEIRTRYWDSPKLHSSSSILEWFYNRSHGQNDRLWRNIDSWPCFVTKPARVAPADSDVWSPCHELMVEKWIYIENTDFIKCSIFQISIFWWKIDIPGLNMDSRTALEPLGPAQTPKQIRRARKNQKILKFGVGGG